MGAERLHTYSPEHERYLSIRIRELVEICAELEVPLLANTGGRIQTLLRYRYQLPTSRLQEVVAGHARRHAAEFSDPKYDLVEVADIRRDLEIADDSEWGDVLRVLNRPFNANLERLPRYEVANIRAVLGEVRENLNERGHQSASSGVRDPLYLRAG